MSLFEKPLEFMSLDIQVDLCGSQFGMPQELSDMSDAHSIYQQRRGRRCPNSVWFERCDSTQPKSLLDGPADAPYRELATGLMTDEHVILARPFDVPRTNLGEISFDPVQGMTAGRNDSILTVLGLLQEQEPFFKVGV